MIVKHTSEGWEIISHYTHGLLAGKLANALQRKYRVGPWIDVLTAVVEHDDHLLDFEEQNYLTEQGTPMDFTMDSGSNSETLEHAKRLYSKAVQKSQLIALLVGRHLEFLNEQLAKEHEPMRKFLDTIKGLRPNQRKLYGLEKEDEERLYNILLFCDRCSLILAQDKLPEVERQLEINCTIDGEQYFIKNANGFLHVEPWPFEDGEFSVSLEYRVLNQPIFKDNQDLKNHLEKAEILMKQFTFRKQ